MDKDYSDIINLPHHVSEKHGHMSMHGRAGQFAPFAALTGYGDAIDQTSKKAAKNNEFGEVEYCSDDDMDITVFSDPSY